MTRRERAAVKSRAKARLQQALQGHESWVPERSGELIRFTDEVDPFSGEKVTSVRPPLSYPLYSHNSSA